MSNEPRFKYPDTRYDISKGNLPDGPGDLETYFGKSRYLEMSARDGKPIDALTLQQAYGGANSHIADILHYNFVGIGGWWTDLLPLKRVEGLNQSWAIYNFPRQSMDPAPEETSPRKVTFSKEDHTESLTRFSIGGKAYRDFEKTPEGKAEMAATMSSMVSGGWITAKLLVAHAVFNAKLYWEEYKRQYGPTYVNVMDALADEIRLFGALSKDDQGLYKLHGHAGEVTKEANPAFDMIILAKGALNFVAFSGSYERESFRRGEAPVQQRLSLGARSLVNVLPGVTIYEDETFSLANMGPDEIQQFTRIAVIGRFFMIDGSNFGEHQKEYHASKELSCKAVSMDIDDWALWKINTVIDHSMRWKGDHSLSDSVRLLANNVQSFLARSGMKLQDERLVDPYIWRAQDGSYHPIAHWGDMDKAYFSHEQTKLHGEMAAKTVLKKMSPEQQRDWRNLKALRDRLLTLPDVLDESFQGFAFAVAANPENRNGPADFSGHNSFMLKPNRFGFSQPPFVDRTPGASNGREGELDMPHGALYIKNGDRRLYIWAIYPEELNGTTHTFRATDPILAAEGTTTRATPVPTPPSVTYASFRPVYQPGMPGVFVAATFDAFGPVDARGRAHWFDNHIKADSIWHSIAWRRLQGRADGGAVTGGIQAPQLVKAPPIPIGYGVIAGLRTIAQLHSEGDTRGWNKDDLETAFKGIQVAKDVGSTLVDRLYPECELAQEKYVPYYMKTTDAHENKVNSVFANLWDEVRYPIWVRIPGINRTELTSGDAMIAINTDIRTAKRTERGMTDADRLMIYRYMGLNTTAIGGRDRLTMTTPDLGAVEVPEEDAVRNLANLILSNPHLDPGVLNALKDSERGGAASKLFGSYSSSTNTGLGQAYQTHLANVHGIRNASTDFAWFVVYELLPISRRSGLAAAVSVLNSVLGLCLVAMHGTLHRRYTAESLANLIRTAEVLGINMEKNRNNKDDQGKDAEAALNESESGQGLASPFINTRLCVSADAFHALADMLEGAPPDDVIVVRSANSVVRPSDPRNGGRPAGAKIQANADDPLDTGMVKTNQASFQYARASKPRGLGTTTLAHDILLGPDDGEEEHFQVSPYTRKRKRNMPDSVLNDAAGPLYEDVNQRQWLVKRFEAMSKRLPDDDLARMCAQMLCLTRVNRSSLKTLVKECLPIPDCCFVIAQPWIRIRTSAGVWAMRGSQTGEIAYNYEDVVLQFNGMNKTWHMHYTIWLNAAIYDETRILILKDIKFEGYIGGMDSTINSEEDLSTWDPLNINFARVKSSFVFSCGARFTREIARKIANPLPLSGRYDPMALPVNFADRNSIFNPECQIWPSALYYSMLWGFHEINNNAVIGPNTYQGVKETTYLTGLMPMAAHKIYDPNTGDWTKDILGTGHLDCLKPPMREILSGKVQFKCDKQC